MRTSRRLISTPTGVILVEVRGGASESCGDKEHPQLPAPQRMHRQPGPRQQPAKVVDAPELAHGVEAPVEDAVSVLQLGEQALQGLGRRPRLRRQVGRPGFSELLPHPVQARRVLPDEQLRGEVEGVERAREGPQLRLVDLEPHHLADAELHPVEAHRPVVLEVRQHEEEGQVGRRLGSRESRTQWSVHEERRSGSSAPPLRVWSVVRSAFSTAVFSSSRSMGWGRCRSAAPGPHPWPT